MEFRKREWSVSAEADMTPMIDMTFQLIAFFMVLLNFGEGAQDARIKLPSSELAKPPEGPLESPITLQMTERGTVYFVGDELSIADMSGPLLREKQVLEAHQKSAAEATVVVRADANAEIGAVQELIKTCQETGFENFKLRVKQDQPPYP